MNTVNCWDTLRAAQADWAISSQAFWRQDEGSTTRSWSLTETVKTHERGAPVRGDDIVWATSKDVEARIKSLAITTPLFPSISTSVGTSGSNLTIANMVEAQASIRAQKMRGQLVTILDDQAALDYQVAQAAATSTTINSLMMPAVDGSTDSAYLGTFFAMPVFQTGLCDTANTAANVVSACFIRGDTNPTTAWGGACMVRDVRTELDRDIQSRASLFAGSAKWGVAQIAAESGVKIVTDA